MAKVLLTIRIEEQTKLQLKSFSKDLGLTLSSVVAGLIKQAVRDRRIFLTTQVKGSYTLPIVDIPLRTIPLTTQEEQEQEEQ